MAKLKDENLTVVGFFGQSGAGKSTIIKSIPSNIGGKGIIKKTDVIRGLFSKNPQSYRNPQEFISQKDEIFGKANPGSLISEMYTKYIRSQFQLMNDFSSEVFDAVRQDYSSKSIMLFDRCPMDFQVLTECGLDKLHDEFGGKYNSTHNLFRDLVKKTSITNTKNFFDIIFVVKPWVNENINILNDGVRDQYLSNHFTGDNWYNKLDGIDFGNTKVYYVDEALNTIESRVNFIANTLGKK